MVSNALVHTHPHTVIPEPSNKFTTIYGTLMFITVFAADRYVSLSSNGLLQRIICEIHFNIILQPTHRSPNSFHLSHFPTKRLHLSHLPCMSQAPHHILLHFTTRLIFGEMYKIVTSSKFNFLLPSYIQNLTSTSFHNILVCNTISFSSSVKN